MNVLSSGRIPGFGALMSMAVPTLLSFSSHVLPSTIALQPAERKNACRSPCVKELNS